MVLKILTIPVYVLVFGLGLAGFVVLGITGIGLLFYPLLIFIFFLVDYFLLLTTSSFGLSAIRQIKKEGILPKSVCILLQVCHFLFVIDIIMSIFLYLKIRKYNDTEEDKKYRKSALIKAAITLLVILCMIGIYFFINPLPPEGYSTYNLNQTQMDDYIQNRFKDANEVILFPDMTTFKDKDNKEYNEWTVKVDNISCHAASIETVLHDGLGGKVAHTYYRTDTDCDYEILSKLIEEKYYSWKMPDNTIETRYDEHKITIEYNYSIDYYGQEELDNLSKEIKNIKIEAKNKLIKKEIHFKLKKNNKEIHITNENKLDQLYE